MENVQLTREERDIRSWGAAIHLSALVGLFVPFGNILAPLVIWLIKRHDAPELDHQGVAALNFQISMTIYLIVAGILILAVIGIILIPVIVVLDIVYLVIAAVQAGEGRLYRYPFSIPFLK